MSIDYEKKLHTMITFLSIYEEEKDENGFPVFKKNIPSLKTHQSKSFVKVKINDTKILIEYSNELFILAQKAFPFLSSKQIDMYISKFIYKDYLGFIERKKMGQGPLVDVKIESMPADLKKIEQPQIFKNPKKIQVYSEMKNDNNLKFKHSCSSKSCLSNEDPIQSHYIPKSVLKNLNSDDSLSIYKLYPFDLIDEEISHHKTQLDHFIMETSAAHKRYTTARIYCGPCDNNISIYEEALFNKEELILETIKIFEQRFIDFIKVKNREFSFIRKSLNLKKEKYKKADIVKDRFTQLKNIKNVINKENPDNFDSTFFFEIKDSFPISSIVAIDGDKIKEIFNIEGEKNLKNARLKNALLIIHLFSNKNGCFLSFSFRNLNYLDASIVTTFFDKNFTHNHNAKNLLSGVYNAIFHGFSETFISKPNFDRLPSLNKTYILIASSIKHITYRDTITLKPITDNVYLESLFRENNIKISDSLNNTDKKLVIYDMACKALLSEHNPKIIKALPFPTSKNKDNMDKYNELRNLINNEKDIAVDIHYEEGKKIFTIYSFYKKTKVLYKITRKINKDGNYENEMEYINPDLIQELNFYENRYSARCIKDILLAYAIHQERIKNLSFND